MLIHQGLTFSWTNIVQLAFLVKLRKNIYNSSFVKFQKNNLATFYNKNFIMNDVIFKQILLKPNFKPRKIDCWVSWHSNFKKNAQKTWTMKDALKLFLSLFVQVFRRFFSKIYTEAYTSVRPTAIFHHSAQNSDTAGTRMNNSYRLRISKSFCIFGWSHTCTTISHSKARNNNQEKKQEKKSSTPDHNVSRKHQLPAH